jgi:uncharacterized protein (TIGR04255 family)
MAKQRYLNNAPIVEAIVDLRVRLAPAFDVTGLASLQEAIRVDYPKMEQRREFLAGIDFAGKQVQQVFEDKGLGGYISRSDDGKNVIQFRRDGFTFSRLRPYTQWETVAAEAKRLWGLYSAKASPGTVTRIALRCINNLSIRLPINDFADYLTAPPTIPHTLPQELRHFMTRVTVREAELDTQANIIQALDKSAKPDEVAIFLDIDVYKEQETDFDDSKIWSTFELLRELKNRIFFDSITEKTARLFE